MPTVKMLQDWKSRKEGETWSPSESTARLLVASGKAVLVEEPRVDPEPVTVQAVIETEPPISETIVWVPESIDPVPESIDPVVESIDPVVESIDPVVETQDPEPPEPGFQWPADVTVPGPTQDIEPLRPSRYAPHRSWTRQSES